jgi:hypothetical protein
MRKLNEAERGTGEDIPRKDGIRPRVFERDEIVALALMMDSRANDAAVAVAGAVRVLLRRISRDEARSSRSSWNKPGLPLEWLMARWLV